MARILLADAVPYLDKLTKRHRGIAIRGLRLAALKGQQIVITQIIPSKMPHPPVDTGVYRAGWKVKSLPNGATIYNDSPIASIIEFGIRPFPGKVGRKMISALKSWVHRHGMVKPVEPPKRYVKWSNRAKGYVWHQPRVPKSQSQSALETRAAWAIAKTISEEGRLGMHIHEELNERLPEIIDEIVTRELESAGVPL